MRRLSKKAGRDLMKLGWNQFEDITESEKAKDAMNGSYNGALFPDRIWKNNIFIVQVFEKQSEWGLVQHAMIRRNDEAPVHNWSVIQRIKNEIFGEERTALEVYPKQSRLIDDANLYWIWVLPMGYDCPIEV
ncbi:hypothetical protein CMI37_20740 [Candidatus Pacearchaeota archaeon]|nr:hypothetical protein [Candidatus Pacearchaeota archaeon]|tara:strand:+ start:2148 stop:2543 length:396 start_codon:yes stop_codon:yes gene_type:complete